MARPGELYPSFAPNGKAVAFQRGGAPERLLRGAREPSWWK
jgi:hypothetical protein